MRRNDQNAVSLLRSIASELMMQTAFESKDAIAIGMLLSAIKYLENS